MPTQVGTKGVSYQLLLREKLQWKALQLQITSLRKCYSFQHPPNTQDTQKIKIFKYFLSLQT